MKEGDSRRIMVDTEEDWRVKGREKKKGIISSHTPPILHFFVGLGLDLTLWLGLGSGLVKDRVRVGMVFRVMVQFPLSIH